MQTLTDYVWKRGTLAPLPESPAPWLDYESETEWKSRTGYRTLMNWGVEFQEIELFGRREDAKFPYAA